MADIIFWALDKETISADQIKKKWAMGNRVKNIMASLAEMGIISEQFYNQPRKVLPISIQDIPQSALRKLYANGISDEKITNRLNLRNST